MSASLSLKRHLFVLILPAFLLAGCGVTTQRTFLDEPVQETDNNAVPVSSNVADPGKLAESPSLRAEDATGVKRLLNIITPYRTNIQQGNFVSQEMLARLQVGMTKEQVRFALGTPLLTDMFHSSRWDYIFRLQKPTGHITNNRVVIYFEDNRVTKILNDPLPEEINYIETIAGPVSSKKRDAIEKAINEEDVQEQGKVKPAENDQPSDTVEQSTESTPEVVQPVENAPEPSQPVESYQVVEPSQPVESYQAVEPSQPVESYQAVEPSQPVESYQAVEPVQPVESYQAVEPSQPVESYQAVEPSQPVESYQAVEPSQPVESYQAVEPVQPVETYTPQRAKTIQSDVDVPPDDGRATPNSTMQLHQLMQIQ